MQSQQWWEEKHIFVIRVVTQLSHSDWNKLSSKEISSTDIVRNTFTWVSVVKMENPHDTSLANIQKKNPKNLMCCYHGYKAT